MTNSTAYAKGGTTNSPVSSRSPQIVTHEIDLANVTATVTTGAYAVVLNIPADTYFKFLRAEIVTAVSLDAASGGRIDIGDSGSATVFVSNHTTFTAGADMTIAAETGSTVGAYTAADTLRLKLTGDKLAGGTANATGIIRFVWLQGSVARNANMTT